MIEILNMNGGRFYGNTNTIMKNKIPLEEPYVEKTPNKFKFFLDVDIKGKEFDERVIDTWLPNENAWIAKCNENKGYHIIFENIICNSKEEAVERFKKLNNYNDVLDKQVYYTGIRMIHAPKKAGEKRYYRPYKYRKDQEYINIDKTKWYENFFITLEDPMKQVLINSVQRKRTTTNYPYNIYRKVKKNDRILFYSKNRNCGNLVKGEHRSNYIYYELIKGRKLIQKCWCSCDTLDNRKYGFCKRYKSDPIALSLKEYEALNNIT